MSFDPRPVALVTGTVSPYRREPFRLLAFAEEVEVLAWGDATDAPPPGLVVRATSQAGVARLIASRRYRAVICGLGGRVALPAAFLAARAARVPFVLWASLWAHPRTAFHALSALPTRALYRRADAVVTYGAHVSRHLERGGGARAQVFEAPQAVSELEFGRPVAAADRTAARARAGSGDRGFLLLFVGRLEREKGVEVLLDAWRRAAVADGVLAFIGDGALRGRIERADGRVRALGAIPRDQLPPFYAAADALVLPSVRTATFREPWGLVVNEAMHQGTPTITTDAVGAAAGGLVRDGRNGLVAPAGDTAALATRIRALARDPELRRALGRAARADVAPWSEQAWTDGMRRALAAVGQSRGFSSC